MKSKGISNKVLLTIILLIVAILIITLSYTGWKKLIEDVLFELIGGD